MAPALFIAGVFLGVFAHEGGHAVAGWAVGFRIVQVGVGTGPVLLRVRWGEGRGIVVRAIPLGGFITAYSSKPRLRLRQIPFTLGGVAGNLALSALLATAAASGVMPNNVAAPIAIAQVVQAAINLVPFRTLKGVPGLEGYAASDGLILLGLLFSRQADAEAELGPALLQGWAGTAAIPPAPPPPPGDLLELAFHISRPDRADAWVRRDVADAMRRLLRDGRLAGPYRAMALDLLVEIELLYGDTGLDAPTLDAWSREAVTLLPIPAVEVTRGCVLVTLGRELEGVPILEAILAQAPETHLAVLSQAFLAQAAAQRSDSFAAAERMRQARSALGPVAGTPFGDRLVSNLNRIEANWHTARYTASPPQERLRITPAGLLACMLLASGLGWWARQGRAWDSGWQKGYAAACRRWAPRITGIAGLQATPCDGPFATPNRH